MGAEQKAVVDEIAGKLEAERTTLKDLETWIAERQTEQVTTTEKIALVRKVEGKIDNFESEYGRLERETAADLGKIGLNLKAILALTIKRDALVKAREAMLATKSAAEKSLDPGNSASLIALKAACFGRIKELQDQLDAPNKQFQQYNEAMRAWKEKVREIEGDASKPDTLKWYEAQLKYISNELPADLNTLRAQRRQIAENIHKCVADIRDVYKDMFSAVQDLISGSVIIKEGFKLTFESGIVDRSFQVELFERYISQGNAGSFYGKEKGAAALEELRANFDVNIVDEAVEFAEGVTEYLRFDMRTAQRPQTVIASQLRKGVDTKMLYDFLWGFSYLEPEYSLKLDGRDLSHLSPGERGTLLLVFYLLVDKSNKPIIVDQPEENLDNQTVYRLLIPVIKEVKKCRQIIMVTHSPNIAVVCDAEQIIHAHIDRGSGNTVIYTMGSIEAPEINRFLVDVLEGTRPAFDNRDAKYLPA